MEPLITFKGIKKYFSGTKALDWNPDDTVEVMPGEIHGLVGENGAGKSTLIQLLMGIYERTAGEIIYQGAPFISNSVLDAKSAGISIIMQQPNLAHNLTVAENIFLGQDKRFRNKLGLINWKMQNEEAAEVLNRVDYPHIKPTSVISKLGFEERKQVEIAHALAINPKVLLVDETSAAISKVSVDKLYNQLREQRDKGVAVIYISHFIDEVYDICDRISILRDGKYIDTLKVEETTPDMIISKMVGRDISMESYRSDDNSSIADEVLDVRKLTRTGEYEDIDLKMHAGEIVGIAGIGECGSEELGRTLFGCLVPTSGEVFYKGKPLRLNIPADAVALKIGYLPKDRDREGLIAKFSIAMNMSSANLRNLTKYGIIDQKNEKRLADEYVQRFKVMTPSIMTNILNLSGGNRQKVAIAKWAVNHSDLLIVNSPTRGVDVGAKYEIYKILEEAKNEGKAILIISDELPELLGMSDRIYILRKGRVSAEVKRGEAFAEETVMAHMV